jgi:hypothetical protein
MAFRSVFIFLFLLLSVNTFSQTVEWGNPQKIKQRNLYSQIVGESAAGIFVLRCKNADFSNDVILEKYKTNLTLDLSVPAPITINGNIERVLLVNGELHIFISAKNIQTGNIDILDQKVDAALKAIGSPSVICTFSSAQFIEKRKIQIKTSANKGKVLVMFLTRSANTGECKLNLYGYNDQMQQQFGKQFTLNERPEDVFITNFESDNNGNAFVLIDFPAKVGGKKVDSRDFFLYAFYPAEDRMLSYDIGNENIFIEELALSINNFNQTISVLGFYSASSESEVNGYFFERFSIPKRSTEEKFAAPIDVAILQKATGGKIEKKDPDLKNFYIRKLVPRSDGGIFLVAEKYTRVEQRYNYYMNNMPQEGIRITYNYYDVALFSINKDGSFHFLNSNWAREKELKKVKNGTHPFLTKEDGSSIGQETNKKRVESGSHNFLGPDLNKKRFEDGTHPILKMLETGNHPAHKKWTCNKCGMLGKGMSQLSRHKKGKNCKS